MIRHLLILSAAALCLLPAAPISGQEITPTAPAPTEQMLKPGDIVQLNVWREPEFSGDYQVDAAGFVTLPRLGELRVLDYTPAMLEAELSQRYRQFLRNPSIEIIVRRRIRILGAVQAPNVYNIDPTITIADALALAGGVTPQGDQNKIELRRDGQVLAGDLSSNTALAETPLRSGDQLFVPERSWLSRNTGLVGAMMGGLISIIVAITR